MAMKILSLATAAAAAILVNPVVGAAQDKPWQGAYLSVNGGYGFQPDDASETIRFDKNLDGQFTDTVTNVAGADAFAPGFCGGAANTPRPDGGCVEDEDGADFGGRLGFDWQKGQWVFGLLGEGSATDVTDSVSAFSITPARYAFTRELTYVAALRARVGVASGRVLLYATGGGARGSIDNSFSTSNLVNTFVRSDADSAWGYQAGGGLEFRLGKVSLGAEALYTSLSDEDEYSVRVQGPAPATNPFILTNPSGTDFRRDNGFKFTTARLTASYRF
jgi:opacity protein-like surface antigen